MDALVDEGGDRLVGVASLTTHPIGLFGSRYSRITYDSTEPVGHCLVVLQLVQMDLASSDLTWLDLNAVQLRQIARLRAHM